MTQQWKKNRNWLDRAAAGASSNITDIVKGIPGMAREGAGYLSGGAAGLYGLTRAPGWQAARRYRDKWDVRGKQMARETVNQYKEMYGPLFRGEFRKFGGNVLDNPVFIGLDVAGGWGALAKGVGTTSRATRAAGLGRDGGMLERLAARSVESPHLQRSPMQVAIAQSTEHPGAGTFLEVPRSPMSRNPLTRELIQRPLQPARDWLGGMVRGGMDKAAGENPSGARRFVAPLGSVATANRVARRETGDVILRHNDAARHTENEGIRAFMESQRKLGSTFRQKSMSFGGKAERDAVMLHAQGLLGIPGMSPAENIALLRSRLEEGVSRAKDDKKKTRHSEKQPARFKELERRPDLMVEYEKLPPRVRDAVDAARATMSDNQRRLVQTHFLRQETADEVRGRAAREVYGGEEGVGHLRSPRADERAGELTRQIQDQVAKISWMRSPRARQAKLTKVRQVRQAIQKAETYKVSRPAEANRQIALAQRLMAEIRTDGPAMPARATGDAQVVVNPANVDAKRALDAARTREAKLAAVVNPVIQKGAADMVRHSPLPTSIPGKRKAKMRYRPAQEFFGEVEDGIRGMAHTRPRDGRSLKDHLEAVDPIGDAPSAGRGRLQQSDRALRSAVEREMIRENFGGLVVAIGGGKRMAPGPQVKAWHAEHARRVEARKQRRSAAARPLAAAEIVARVEQEFKNVGRASVEKAAERIASDLNYRVPVLVEIRDIRRRRLEAARAADDAKSTAQTKRVVKQAAREAVLADRAYRVAVERRLLDAEPEVRAQAIAQGLIDESAPSTNPRVLAAMMDELDGVVDDIWRLEGELGVVREGDVDVAFGVRDAVDEADVVETRSAREVRGENARKHLLRPPMGGAGGKVRHKGFRDDGPRAMLEREIAAQRLDKAAVRAGYQPEDVTRRVKELTDELVGAESELAVARATENAPRKTVEAERAELRRLRAERRMYRDPKKLDDEIKRLEARVQSGKITADEVDRLADLRDVRQRRSSPAPIPYRDVIPSVREYMRAVRDDPNAPPILGLSDEVNLRPDVVAATERTGQARDRFAAAVEKGEGVQKAARELEQAYYLEREARIKGVREEWGVEWLDNPDAEHLAAIPLDNLVERAPSPQQMMHGRVTQQKAKQGKGTLRSDGNFDAASVRGVVEQNKRAAVMEQHPKLVREIIDRFGARTDGGKGPLVRGNRALEMMRSDPGQWTMLSAKSLDDLFAKADDLAEGEWLDGKVVDRVLRGDGADFVRGKGDDMDWVRGPDGRVSIDRNDVVLIPKSVAREWAEATNPKRFKVYDTGLQMWKAGMLAFHPRWYVYNMFGNSLQYGIMSLGDIRSIREMRKHGDVIRDRLGSVGQDVRQASLAQDASIGGVNVNSGVTRRVAYAGFRVNEAWEGFLRDAAMWSATKKELRTAGRTKRGATAEDVLRAIDELPPDSPILREAARTAKLFMGDYRRFTPFERAVMRRVFPFYSWLRVIGRLTMALPFKAPIRTELLSIMAQMSYYGMSEEDRALEKMRPSYNRGGIPLPGGMVLRTTSANPFDTVTPWVESLIAERSPRRFVQEIAPSVTPVVGGYLQAVTGKSVLTGRDFTHPTGHDGRVQQFGREDLRRNPVSGSVESAPPAGPSIPESMAQSFLPFYGSSFRTAVAWGERPYDTANTLSVLGNRVFGLGRKDQIFMPKKTKASGYSPVGPGGILSVVGSEAGFPVQRRDVAAEWSLLQRLNDAYASGEKSMLRKIERERQERAGG